MSETTGIRRKIALEIAAARRAERQHMYQTSRGGEEYLELLRGLGNYFHYVRGLETSNAVLDIGAGTGKAASQLAESSLGSGLDFSATTLSLNPEAQHIDKSRIHLTSAEVLRGFEPHSIGGVIALFSLSYSVAPEVAVRRINEILVDGGVIKATIWPEKEKPDQYWGFMETFKELGYDIATRPLHRNEYPQDYILLLGIKPGAKIRISAEELIAKDEANFKEDQKILAQKS